MKNLILLFSVYFFFFIHSNLFAEHWPTSFGFDVGMTSGGPAIDSKNNPLIIGTNKLTVCPGFTGSVWKEFYNPSEGANWGIKVKLNYTTWTLGNYGGGLLWGGSDPECMIFHYLSVPVLFHYKLGSSTIWQWDSNVKKYSLPFTRGIFLHAGVEPGILTGIGYGGANGDTFDSLKTNVKKFDIPLNIGVELYLQPVYFDLSYQKGLISVYPGYKDFISGIIFRLSFKL